MEPTRAVQQHGTGKGGKRTGRGDRRAVEGGESRRLRRAGVQRSGEGNFDERAAADKEDERASHGGGWAYIAVVLPLPWFRDVLCKYDKSTSIT